MIGLKKTGDLKVSKLKFKNCTQKIVHPYSEDKFTLKKF